MRAQWVIRLFALTAATIFGSFAGTGTGALAGVPPAEGADILKSEPPGEMLHTYLLNQAQQHFDARRKAIAAIKTPEDVGRRAKDLRAFFLSSLGDLPKRTPLNPVVVGTLKRDGYRVDKVIFESRLNHHVTGNFYLPDGKPPFPGVLLPCGHSDNGKAYADYQRAAILLAKNGIAVFCYDPIGQGERYQLLDKNGKPVIRGTTEHTMAGIGALLVGRQSASYRIWDGFRAIDYLATRPEVDPSRLGCTGNSGGGTMTSYLMALDDRISVAAPSCFITSLERLFATIGPQDAEQNITGQVAAGMEHPDYVTMRAPKPTLLTVGTRDFFDIKGSWDTFREVKLIYGRFGFGERVDLFESDEEHGFTQPRRVATARWMMRWLLKKDDAVIESDLPISTHAELQCTKSGQVMSDFKDASVFDLNRQREAELRAARVADLTARSPDAFRALVKKKIGLEHWKARPVPLKPVVARREREMSSRTLVFEIEPGITLSATEWVSEGRESVGPTLVIVGGGNSGSSPATESPSGSYRRVVRFNPRGMGDTGPKAGQGQGDSPFGRDWRDAYIALHIGRPLLGQRVADLLVALECLAAESGIAEHAGFDVVGIGSAGPIVLHAALLDERGLIKKSR